MLTKVCLLLLLLSTLAPAQVAPGILKNFEPFGEDRTPSEKAYTRFVEVLVTHPDPTVSAQFFGWLQSGWLTIDFSPTVGDFLLQQGPKTPNIGFNLGAFLPAESEEPLDALMLEKQRKTLLLLIHAAFTQTKAHFDGSIRLLTKQDTDKMGIAEIGEYIWTAHCKVTRAQVQLSQDLQDPTILPQELRNDIAKEGEEKGIQRFVFDRAYNNPRLKVFTIAWEKKFPPKKEVAESNR